MTLADAMEQVDNFIYDGGSTPMSAAFAKASQLHDEMEAKGNARELVIMFTDGEPDNMEQAMAASHNLRDRGNLMLHGVGIGDGILMSNLEQITDHQCTRMEMH